MKNRHYRVEAQAKGLTTWEIVYYSDSLPVAKRYAASLRKSGKVRDTRVVDEFTDRVVSHNPT